MRYPPAVDLKDLDYADFATFGGGQPVCYIGMVTKLFSSFTGDRMLIGPEKSVDGKPMHVSFEYTTKMANVMVGDYVKVFGRYLGIQPGDELPFYAPKITSYVFLADEMEILEEGIVSQHFDMI